MNISFIALVGVIGLVIGHLMTKLFSKRKGFPKEIRMSTKKKVALVEKLTEELNIETSRAVCLYAILSCVNSSDTLHKELASKLDNTEECSVFKVYQHAVLAELVMTLMRMHDNRKQQRKNVCFEELFYHLEDRSVVAKLGQNANEKILSRGIIVNPDTQEMREGLRKKRSEDAQNARANAINILDAARKNFKRIKGSHFKSCLQKKVRHEMYAHNALDSTSKQKAKYGYIEPLLRDTLSLVDKLNESIFGINKNFKTDENNWSRLTKSLWMRLN